MLSPVPNTTHGVVSVTRAAPTYFLSQHVILTFRHRYNVSIVTRDWWLILIINILWLFNSWLILIIAGAHLTDNIPSYSGSDRWWHTRALNGAMHVATCPTVGHVSVSVRLSTERSQIEEAKLDCFNLREIENISLQDHLSSHRNGQLD